MSQVDTRPLVCHIIHRLDFGGLENGLVNLINGLPREQFRHAVIALTEVTDFAERIQVPDVQIFALGKRPGTDLRCYVRLFRLLRELRPLLLHTRNLGTLDCQVIAWAAGVPNRIHGEHGWDVYDPEGREPRYVRLRRIINPWVHRYVALSGEIERWLTHHIRVGRGRVWRICNGVDSDRFVPAARRGEDGVTTLGTVSRFTDIKDPLAIIEAFILLRRSSESGTLRLLLVGDGPLRPAMEQRVLEAGLAGDVEFAGSQMDVIPWLQRMDVFALGSRREGISNTILEAMACGLPVVATRTGGNPELVDEHETGRLVPVGDHRALASALQEFVSDGRRRREAGCAARQRVLENFSIHRMIERYTLLYQRHLRG